jgi:hypothetical protein
MFLVLILLGAIPPQGRGTDGRKYVTEKSTDTTGNRPGIVRLVAQHLNHYATPCSEESGGTVRKPRGEDESQTACTDVSEKEKLEILKEIHDSHIGGRAGINHTYRKFTRFINWQDMKSDVEKYIRDCEKIGRIK